MQSVKREPVTSIYINGQVVLLNGLAFLYFFGFFPRS